MGPPNYAPDLLGIVTLYDVLANTYIGNWWEQKKKPSFTRDIHPILERFCTTQWVNQGFFNEFGWRAPNDFLRQLDVLSAPGKDFEERRRQIFNQLRYPQQLNSNLNLTVPDNTGFSAGSSIGQWPVYYGDAVTLSNVNPNAYMPVTELMYQYLGQWAAGDFEADWEGPPEHPVAIDQVPLQEQPAMLDRAAMEFCLGGPFHPGCEMTWPMRNYTMYTEPFRIRHWPAGAARADYGDFLLPEQVYSQNNGSPTVGGPLYFQGPGDITRWMAVPWQTDSASCRSGYAPQYDPYLPTFWPQRVPNQVLTEETYQKIMSSPPPEGWLEFQKRAVWYRFLGPDYDNSGQIDTMIHRFGDLGLVERRPGPGTPGLPAEMYVETGVQFKDDRVRFDAMLRRLAQEAGAELRTGTRLRRFARAGGTWRLTLEPPERVQARWLIDATGRAACVARRLGARTHHDDRQVAFTALFEPGPGAPPHHDTLTLVESVPDGWWYTALLPGGRRVAAFLTDSDLAAARTASRPSGFDALLARTRHVRPRLAAGGFARITAPRGGPASSSRLSPGHGDGWVAVGDAALAFDPLSSQGILTALYGGLRGAGAIHAELAGLSGRVAGFVEELDRVHEAYRRNRQRIYAEERRWEDRELWRRRRLSAPTPGSYAASAGSYE